MARRPACPPGKCARIIQQTGLIREKLLPTNIGRIRILMDRRPSVHRPPPLTGLPRPALGVWTATPIHKGAGIGRVVQDLRDRRVCRFPPEHMPRV